MVVALIARIAFHEEISPTRWLGIALIAAGVGFVAVGPSATPVPHDDLTVKRGSADFQVKEEVRS